MRKSRTLLLLFTMLLTAWPLTAPAATRDASDLFLRAYLQIQEGDAAAEKNDWSTAQGRYQDALLILKDIESVQPDWNPHIIKFRKHYCEEHITTMKAKQAAAAAAVAPPAPPTPAPPAATSSATQPAPADSGSEANRLRDLSIALDRLRQEVQRLQAERVATTMSPPSDNETVRRLQADLAEARRQNELLLAEKNRMATAPAASNEVAALRAQTERSKDELARQQTERASLLRQLQDKDQKLAAQEKLSVNAASVEMLREENQKLARKLVTAEADSRVNAQKIMTFSSTAGELAVARAQVDKLREDLAKAQEKDKEMAKLQKANEALTGELTKTQTLLTMSKSSAENRAQVDKLREDLAKAQEKDKELAKLQKANEALTGQLTKAQTLLVLSKSSAGNPAKGDSAEVATLKQQLTDAVAKLGSSETRTAALQRQAQDALAQLQSLRSELAQHKAQPAIDDAEKQTLAKENALLQAALDRKEAELRQGSHGSTFENSHMVLVRQLRAQLLEAKNRLAARDHATETIEKENAILKVALDKKAQEYEKSLRDQSPERTRIAELEKALNDAQKHLAFVESNNQKLTPEEEAFLKRTEVVVHPPEDEAMSGEISASLLRAAKESALDEVTARYRKTVPQAPPPTFAQADTGSDKTTASDATNTVSRPQPNSAVTNVEPAKPAVAKLSPELKKLVDEARELYNEKKFDEAAAKYREVLKRDPENLYGLSNLAVIRFQQNRLEEAERLLNRAVTVAPDDAYSHSIIGIIYYKQNRIDEAIDELTRSVKLNPENSEAHNYLGIACWQKGWKSAAEQELRKAIELKPDYADAHFNLAVIYATQKPPFLGLAKFHYRKTLDLGRQRDEGLEKIFAGETK